MSSLIIRSEGYGKYLKNVVEDLSPNLGGDLGMGIYGLRQQLEAGENLTDGDWVYLKNDNKLYKLDASAVATVTGFVGLCIQTKSTGELTHVVHYGVHTVAGYTAALTYYASETAGAATVTAPAIKRELCYGMNGSRIFINPQGIVIDGVKGTTRVTTTYAILTSDDVVFCNTDSAGFTATLPVGVDGQTLKIINSGSSGKILTLAPNGAEHLIGVNSSITMGDSETIIITYNTTDGWY